jgi:hypothetical protein
MEPMRVESMRADVPRDLLASLRRLSDGELAEQAKSVAGRERDLTALLVAHVAELDTRDVHLRAGYPSLFCYCRDVLALSEHEAYNRIEVARAARRHPVILALLAGGSVNLTTVRLLRPHLTPENHQRVLESACGKKKAQVEEIVARISPRLDVPAFVRKLPGPRPDPTPAAKPAFGGEVAAMTPVAPLPAEGPNPPPSPGPPLPRPRPSGEVAPLSPDRYRLQLTIGGSTLEKLRLAKDMLRHVIPWGDDAAILERALSALLAELARTRFAASESPRPARGTAPGSRYIPAEVKRAVWVRDLGRCAYVGTNGRRCGERAFVEFHHVRPYAAGGKPAVENIQLRCRSHNVYESRLFFDRRPSADGACVAEESAEPRNLCQPAPHGTELVPERMAVVPGGCGETGGTAPADTATAGGAGAPRAPGAAARREGDTLRRQATAEPYRDLDLPAP